MQLSTPHDDSAYNMLRILDLIFNYFSYKFIFLDIYFHCIYCISNSARDIDLAILVCEYLGNSAIATYVNNFPVVSNGVD